MGFMDKFKNAFSMSEEEYLDEVDMEEDEEEEEEYTYTKPRFSRHSRQAEEEPQIDNVVNMRTNSNQAPKSDAKAHVVFKKIDTFEEVISVADVLIEQRIVILNLETCADDASRRILDVLSGVAYANDGKIRRVAGRAYIITPNNVPLTGELLDEVVNSAANNSVF